MNDPNDAFDDLDTPEEVITPFVLSDPLNPGRYLPAACKHKLGAWRKGKIYLHPQLRLYPWG